MSVARDGTGGIVFLKDVGGVQHVFVSRLVGGAFLPPEQADATFTGPSSQPVIAAGNGGTLLVAFLNGGTLYAVDRSSANSPYQVPVALASPAANPVIQMSNFGKAYLAFALAAHGGSDVRAAYYYNGRWALEPAPLNVTPGDDAGSSSGRPAVATAGDGVATVVWGEGGHIYSRRVWGTSPSVVYEQADPPSVNGWRELGADLPAAAAGGDSSYVGVVFRETFADGGQRQQRVLLNRLHGSVYDGPIGVDGLSTPGPDQAYEPGIAMGELGFGLATSARISSHEVFAGALGYNGAYTGTGEIDTTLSLGAPDVVPATVGLSSFVVTWQDRGLLSSEIHARYWTPSSGFGPDTVVSDPSQGPTDAARGLAAGGDARGDVAVAWVQGTGAGTRIMVGEQYQVPGAPQARRKLSYDDTTRPVVGWNPGPGWGPITYLVSVDRIQVGSTTATSFRVPTPLAQGIHSWQVTAVNPAGLEASSRIGWIWIDTVPPVLRFSLAGSRRQGQPIEAILAYRDPPPAPTGVSYVVIHWGDGSSTPLRPGSRRATHVYSRAGRYRITVVAKDRAGNTTRVSRRIAVAGR